MHWKCIDFPWAKALYSSRINCSLLFGFVLWCSRYLLIISWVTFPELHAPNPIPQKCPLQYLSSTLETPSTISSRFSLWFALPVLTLTMRVVVIYANVHDLLPPLLWWFSHPVFCRENDVYTQLMDSMGWVPQVPCHTRVSYQILVEAESPCP